MRKMNPFTAVQEIERSLLRITCGCKTIEIHLSPVDISPAQMADLIDNAGDVTTAKFELRCRPDELPPVITGQQIKEAAERSREKPSPVPFGTVGTITVADNKIKVRRDDPRGVTETHLDDVTVNNMLEAARIMAAWMCIGTANPAIFYAPADEKLLVIIRHGSVCYSIDFDGNMTPSVNWHGNVTKQLTPSDALHRVRAVLHKARKDLKEPKELEFTHDWPDRVGIWAVKQSGAGHHQHFWLQMPTELDIKHRPERSNYKYAFICPLPVVKS